MKCYTIALLEKCQSGVLVSEIRSLLPLPRSPCAAEAAGLLGDEILGAGDEGSGLDGAFLEGADRYCAHAFGEVAQGAGCC